MCHNLTAHNGVCVANTNFLFETTAHCAVGFIEKKTK